MNEPYEPLAGTTIRQACAEAYKILAARGGNDRSITFKFNDKTVTVRDTDVNGERAAAMFLADIKKRTAEYAKSPAGIEAAARRAKAEQEIVEAEEARRQLSGSPITIKPGMEEAYANYVKVNSTNSYSFGIVRYAEKWASLMESYDDSRPFAEVAQEAARLVDTEGITGYMYVAAVAALSKFWWRGEDLRRWHNKDVQLGTEGDRANEEGGVLNPALLCVS